MGNLVRLKPIPQLTQFVCSRSKRFNCLIRLLIQRGLHATIGGTQGCNRSVCGVILVLSGYLKMNLNIPRGRCFQYIRVMDVKRKA
jgi:hypothetical protein